MSLLSLIIKTETPSREFYRILGVALTLYMKYFSRYLGTYIHTEIHSYIQKVSFYNIESHSVWLQQFPIFQSNITVFVLLYREEYNCLCWIHMCLTWELFWHNCDYLITLWAESNKEVIRINVIIFERTS